MLSVRGKLAKGKKGTLSIEGDKVFVKEEKGFFRKRLENVNVINVTGAISTSLEEKQPPYKSLIKIKIDYIEGKESLGLVFFSEDRKGLEAVKEEIDADIKKRCERAKLEEDSRIVERESHIHHLSLVLEIIDQTFQVLFELHGEARWGLIRNNVAEAVRIVNEMEALRVVAPIAVDIRGLSSAVSERRVDQIKEEAYAILSVVHRDAERLPHYEGILNFDMELHEVFVKSFILLWDLYLTESVEGQVDVETVKAFVKTFKRLGQSIHSSPIQLALKEMEILSFPENIVSCFKSLRQLILQSLENLIK
ncbi:hypothetical protein CL673_03760 [Candidatus Bathyarchaeota archaeon]|nr:hypothetical protein [Candidatus Bathyarchaeota archaeon]